MTIKRCGECGCVLMPAECRTGECLDCVNEALLKRAKLEKAVGECQHLKRLGAAMNDSIKLVAEEHEVDVEELKRKVWS